MKTTKSIFEDFLGLAVADSKWEKEKKLPLYLCANKYRQLDICGMPYLLVTPSPVDHRGLRGVKADKRKLEEISGMRVLFAFDNIERVKRDALIRARIEFISMPDQAYMPSLGLMLKDKRVTKSTQAVPEKLTATAQMLYLFLQYHGKRERTKIEIAEKLSMPATTMTHAADQLLALNLANSRREGRNVYLSAPLHGYAYYQKAAPYLISPIMKTICVEEKSVQNLGIPSGEDLLSGRSDLASPRYRSVALYKKDPRIKELHPIDQRWNDDPDLANVEIWRYDPELFKLEDGVDPVSVACSLSDIYDERLEYAITEMLEDMLNAE